MVRITLQTLVLVGLGAATAWADFSYEQTTKITGGALADTLKMAGPFAKAAREPQKSSVLVKGNRMAHVSKDSINVVDVDAQTITDINLEKKTYSVMTFAEMKQVMEEMQKRLNPEGQPNTQIKVDIKETGERKAINGFDTRELITTIEMISTMQGTDQTSTTQVVADSWMADDVKGYAEVRKFYQQMAETLGWTPGSNMAMGQPAMRQGMAELYKQSGKMEGIPILQITRVTGQGMAGMTGMPSMSGSRPPSGGESSGGGGTSPTDAAVEAAQRSATQEAVWQATRAGGAAGRIGGAALGGMLGGMGRKKQPKQEAPPPVQKPAEPSTPPDARTAASGSNLLIETTTEMSSHSSAPIDNARMTVPAGFQKVDSDMVKLLKSKP